MALDTTPGPDCESLCSVANADAYHESRGNTAEWSVLDQTRKEQLLRGAYDWLLGRYVMTWPAGLAFGAMDTEGTVPRLVRDACARLALYGMAEPLDAAVEPQVVEETVGPITTKFAKAADAPATRAFPDVDLMLQPYLAVTLAPLTIPLRRT